MADIGSGTGFIAQRLFESAQLRKPVWCIDPNTAMQEVARKRNGVYPVQATGEEFFQRPSINCCFDRVILAGSSHHISDPSNVFKGIERSLRPDGICVVTLPDIPLSNFPLFTKFKSVDVRSVCTQWKKDTLRSLVEANLTVQSWHVDLTYAVTKSKWYEVLRGRFWSTLRGFSDEELEEGIEELERGQLNGIKFNETLDICDTERFIEGKKQ